MPSTQPRDVTWPSLPLEAWSDTCATLHMWTQIVGKIRLVQSPPINHSWSVTLYVTARGLTTSPIPYATRTFQIDFDFISHQLTVQSSDGGAARVPLEAQSVSIFYRRLMDGMGSCGYPEEARFLYRDAVAAGRFEVPTRFQLR